MNICEVQAVPDRMGFEQRGKLVGKTGGDSFGVSENLRKKKTS